MRYAVNPLLRPVAAAPIPVARSWIAGRRFPAEKPLIDVSQAVPGYPPPPEMARHLAGLLGDEAIARYTDVPGLPALREALAADMNAVYGGAIESRQVAITAGCNQAFCFAIQALAAPGDEVILPLPYYFNHQMWLDMSGVRACHLPFRAAQGGLPDVMGAASLVTPKTRAIVLVTPNNPTGAVYPPALIEAFFELAKAKGVALVIDETYRDFLAHDAAPHGLFRRLDWAGTLVQLYSFSKAYCITGYRVGSVIAGAALLEQLEKIIDTVTISAPHIGQAAALFGLQHLVPWRQGNTMLMRRRLAALKAACDGRNDPHSNQRGYRLVTAGAYFAYLEHPFDGRPAEAVAKRLAFEENLLALPGSWFGPEQERYLRLAFANVGEEAMPEIARRLAADAAKG